MKRLIASIALALCAAAAWALPNVADVQTEIGNGNYNRAETMMLEVVTARPSSAKAHYLYAEILAHNKRFTQATEEAAQAKKLDPALSFTQPDKFRSFEQLLEREQGAQRAGRSAPVSERAATPALREPAPMAPAQAQQPVREAGMPSWVWVIGLAAVALIAWKMMRPRTAGPAMGGGVNAPMGSAMAPSYGGGQPMAQPPYGTSYGPGGMPMQAPGSGMLGTGLAVAGGLAAGVMAEKFLEGRRESGNGFGGFGNGGDHSSAAAPGLFGGAPSDDAAARELEQRDVDFGTGGNDWGGDDGGGAAAGGGSDDW